MSLSELAVEEVEQLLENHGFYQHPYPITAYDGTTRGYIPTGEVMPERYYTIAEGDATWHEWAGLGPARRDDDKGRWKKGEQQYEEVAGLGTVYLESQFGGEGQGDNYYIVLRIEDGDTTRYFKKNGYHASHDGSYLDGSLDEVKPAKKTITVYE